MRTRARGDPDEDLPPRPEAPRRLNSGASGLGGGVGKVWDLWQSGTGGGSHCGVFFVCAGFSNSYSQQFAARRAETRLGPEGGENYVSFSIFYGNSAILDLNRPVVRQTGSTILSISFSKRYQRH